MATERPLLTLRIQPRPEARTGGGKSSRSIRFDRLPDQTRVLAAEAEDIVTRLPTQPAFAQSVHLVASMFDDSYATTHTPNDLFEGASGFELVAALGDGYLIEASQPAIRQLPSRIRTQSTVKIRADVSRVKDIQLFDGGQAFHPQNPQSLWEKAVLGDSGRLFFVWLTPLKSPGARLALVNRIEVLRRDGILLAPPAMRLGTATGAVDVALRAAEPDRFAMAEASFRQRGSAFLPVQISSPEKLSQLLGSGTVVRVDPVRRLDVTAPGDGAEPVPPVDLANEPVVAVVDGGCTATSYAGAEAWRASPTFVGNADADARHGNAMVSLIVNGHAWNNNRPLPKLNCRVGIVQAVARRDSLVGLNEYELLGYLEAVARTQPDTKVWNFSANLPALGTDRVSALGEGIAQFARSMRVLPVISIGNFEDGDNRLRPPADCEAALVVGGCVANPDGSHGDWCESCARGLGPQLMQKPDVANFSHLRYIGGATGRASSYATAVTSPLAAHTLARLKEQDPDLAKAVLLHATDRQSHHPGLGWGAPYNGRLPWECALGTATFVFRAELQPGVAYYWNIPTPPALLKDGKLVGGFKLTAILEPLRSKTGTENYFASRLETNLQFKNRQNKTQAILGKLDENEVAEQEARTDHRKWQPVRHFPLFRIPKGWSQSGDMMRLYARVYTRDRFQFDWSANEDAPLQRVAFVLSLAAPDGDENFYNAAVAQLGTLVENAIDLDVEARIETPR